MKVEVLYVADCPTHPAAVNLVKDVLASESIFAEIQEVLVSDEQMATSLGFLGSPTIRVNGRDVVGEPKKRENASLCCRLYRGSEEIGLPPRDMVRKAVLEAQQARDKERTFPLRLQSQDGCKWNRPLKHSLVTVPGIGASLLPKLACPVCWPAYTGLLSSLGLGILISSRYLLALTAAVLVPALIALAFRPKNRHGYGPLMLGAVAAAGILAGKFLWESKPALYLAVGLLIVASIWNAWPHHYQSQARPVSEA